MSALVHLAATWSTGLPTFHPPWGWTIAFLACGLAALVLFSMGRSPHSRYSSWLLFGGLAAGIGAVFCFSVLLSAVAQGLWPVGLLGAVVLLAFLYSVTRG